MNKITEQELKKVREADLSNYDKESNSYFIPKRTTIRIEEDNIYIIKVSESIFNNVVLKDNWNSGYLPKSHYLKADVNKVMSNMIKVTCIELDETTLEDTSRLWTGWLVTDSIEIIKKL